MSVKRISFYSLARYSKTKRDIGMGHKKSNDLYAGDQTPFWRKVAAGQFWPCFGCPKSVESDKCDPLAKTWGITAIGHISHNFWNWALPLWEHFWNRVSVQLNCTLDLTPRPNDNWRRVPLLAVYSHLSIIIPFATLLYFTWCLNVRFT